MKEKPINIGQKIYVIIDYHICAQDVGYLGEDTFICEGYEDLQYPEFYYQPGFFTDPEGQWFPTLEKAQEAYKRKYPATVRFEEIRRGEEWEATEESKKMKTRTFIAKKNLYLYSGKKNWSEDNPTEYGRKYRMTAKEVRDGNLLDTIRKGTRLTIVKNTSGLQTDCPYALAKKKNGYLTIFLKSEQSVPLNWFKEE